jgi:deazaflavin-dependent oxidoreductase (nitroreductase family)
VRRATGTDSPVEVLMTESPRQFLKPSAIERTFNLLFGFLVGLGFGLRHNYLLQVRGRKSGRTYSTPVNILDREGRLFLVAPRGETQWVRNARTQGQVALKKGRQKKPFTISELQDLEKPEILKAYLDNFSTTVQRYFTVRAGAPAGSFSAIAGRHPVFELLPCGEQ